MNDPEAALQEDTTRRLAKLLDCPGIDGMLIADLLVYDVEDRTSQGNSDPDYEGESRTNEATPSLVQSRSERTKDALAGPSHPARQHARSHSRGFPPRFQEVAGHGPSPGRGPSSGTMGPTAEAPAGQSGQGQLRLA